MLKVGGFACLFFILCGGASAEVYKTVDKYGNVSYSDTPSEESESVKLPQINIQPPITPRPTPIQAATAAAKPSNLPNQTENPALPTLPPAASQTRAATQPAQPLSEPSTLNSAYGLRIALPKSGTKLIPSQALTLVLLTTKFLPEGQQFQATVNGRPVGKTTSANNLRIQLPKGLDGTAFIGANVVNKQGQVLEQAENIQVVIQP